jgi:ATP-binding protein involved in chromosome partitioning
VKRIRTYFELSGETRSDVAGQVERQAARVQERLRRVRHTVAVWSGKGGVGKSFVTANLAAALAREGWRVGVCDADVNGPSVARLLGVPRRPLRVTAGGVEPPAGVAGVRVMSMDLLLAADDAPVTWAGPESESFVWRGTLEAGTLREFLADTDWGELDLLLFDLAPGTDRVEPLRAWVPGLSGAVVVTVASGLARFVVGKSLRRLAELGVPCLGVVENMAAYVCPHCGGEGPLFGPDAAFAGVPALGRVPFDPACTAEADAGRPPVLVRPDGPVGRALRGVAAALRARLEPGAGGAP